LKTRLYYVFYAYVRYLYRLHGLMLKTQFP